MTRLRWIGAANIGLGALSLLRHVAEIVSFPSSYFDLRITALFAFDAMVATLWIAAGLCLLSRHLLGVHWAAISAGTAAALTIMSIVPELSISNWGYGE